ncbi:MAG: polysaccharide deacetylase family protein [Eubacteriales bacterium]
MIRRWFFLVFAVIFLCVPASAGEFSGVSAKFVALTFDDGPTSGVTDYLLAGLERRYVNATFFLCGYRMEERPDLVEAIQNGGHAIGIHGYRHAFLQNLSPEAVEKDLATSAQILTDITGAVPTLFRAPGGLVSETVCDVAKNLGLSLIFWSVDPVDWNGGEPQVLADTILQTVKDGDIILMHDLEKTSAEAAFLVIDGLQNQGYVFVTVEELANLRGTSLEPGGRYTRFPRS